MPTRVIIAAGAAVELCLLTLVLPVLPFHPVILFMAVHAVVFVIALVVFLRLRAAHQDRIPGTAVPLIIGFALLFRVTLVPVAPIASDDLYRYVWDGRVGLHGINPYEFAPDDERLVSLHTQDLPAKVNFPSMRTIYPPVAQWAFAFSNALFGPSVAGMKLLFVLCDLVTIGLLVLLLKRASLPAAGVIVYAWSPLPILYFGLDGHVDALGISLLVAAVALATAGRRLTGAVALGAAVLAKLLPLATVPLFAVRERRMKEVVLFIVPAAMLVAASWPYLEPTGGLFESALVFSARWEFNGSLFPLFVWVTGSPGVARGIGAVLLFAWVGWLTFRRRSLVEALLPALLGLLLVAPTVHPWYLTWLAVLLPLRWSNAVAVLLGLSVFSNVAVYGHAVSGVWAQPVWTQIVEYLPFAILAFREIRTGKL